MSVLSTFFSHYPGYGLVLLECIVICLQVQLQGIPIGRLRRQYFDKAFFEKHYPALRDACKGGYPDTGSGRFADKLSDEHWLAFNNAQRAHANYLEQLPTVLVLLLVSGLGAPRVAVPLGVSYIAGRAMYGAGYRSVGPAGRLRGTPLMYVGLIGLLVTAVYTCWTLSGGVPGLTHFAKSYVP